MYSDRLSSSSNTFSGPSGSNSQQERQPEFAIVIARHVLTDTQRQRVILLDAARPSRIVARFCSYIQRFVFNGRLQLLKATPSANSIVCRRFVNTARGYCEIFFVYKDAPIQDTINALNKQMNDATVTMYQDGIVFVPRPVPGPIPVYEGSDYGPRGLLHQISQIRTLPTPASLFLSNENPVPAPPSSSQTQNIPQRTPKSSDVNSAPPPFRSSDQGSGMPRPPSYPPPRPSLGPLSSSQPPETSTQNSNARPLAQTFTQAPRQGTSQPPRQISRNTTSQPNPVSRSAAASSSEPSRTIQTKDKLRADFAVIHAKNIINSQQLDTYKVDRYQQHRFWTYVGQFALTFFEDFKGPKALVSGLNIQSRLIQINKQSYREIFFVSKRESSQRTSSQDIINELKEMLLAGRDDMRKMGKLLLSGPEDISSPGQLYGPSLAVMNDIRAVPAVQILPHLLPTSSSRFTASTRVAPAPESSTTILPAFPALAALPLPHAGTSSALPSGSDPSARVPDVSRSSGTAPAQMRKPPVEIIELSDSDDDIIVLSSPSPAPARQPAPPPVRPRGSLRDVPIDIDALETEIIDLTDDSPARRTVALFDELPLSTDASVLQTAQDQPLPPSTVLEGADIPHPAPVQVSPPSSAVSEEEPPPSSPELEAMAVDVEIGPGGPTTSRTPPPAQDDDLHFAQQEDFDDDDDDPIDLLAAVRALDRRKSDTPESMRDVDMGASSSNGSNKVTLALEVNLGAQESESGPNTPTSAASSDVEVPDECVEDLDAACSEWAREMASKMEPALAMKYLRKAAEHRKDPLDSSFSDRMRAQPTAYQLASYNRRIFESWIIKSTMDEPEAPPIDVKNIVDDDPCPSWDFTYTNLLVRGDGVPKPPKASDLEGCSCVGGCRSDADACSCAQRNMKFAEARNTNGFLYDSQGCLQEFQFPIFECNEACSCAEYCNNRVAQRGRTCNIAIRKTENRGWGVFASEDIPKGTYLGVYSGELLRDEEAEVRGRLYNEYNRTYLFDIDFWYIKLYMKKKRRKFKKGEYCVDAMHAGCFTRYFNHSCDPNSIIVPCVFGEAYPEIPYLAFFTIELIPKDQEITFSYQGGTITDDRERNAARLRADAKRRLGKKKTLKPGTKTFGTIDAPCACGTLLCRGSMWNQESDEDEEDDELDGSDASGSA